MIKASFQLQSRDQSMRDKRAESFNRLGWACLIMGKVTAMTDSSVTVQTKTKDPVTIYTMAETKFEKSGAAASMKDLKVGDSHPRRKNGGQAYGE
jgi:hypothetical protein